MEIVVDQRVNVVDGPLDGSVANGVVGLIDHVAADVLLEDGV